jgi:hypothetical protein
MVTNDLHSVMRRRSVELMTDGSEKWLEVIKEPGLERTRVVVALPWVDNREDCYCCSCFNNSIDPYCRNHGHLGRRSCDTHQMPGSEDTDLLSVEKYIAAHKINARSRSKRSRL